MVEKYKEIEGMTLGEVAYKYGDGSFEEWIKKAMNEHRFISWKIYDMIANITDNNRPAELHRKADGGAYTINYGTEENKERLSTVYEQRTKEELGIVNVGAIYFKREYLYLIVVAIIVFIITVSIVLWRR